MQDEINEKTVALYIKTGKLTAEMLQKAMKALLAKGKQQIGKQPHGKQTLRQLSAPVIKCKKTPRKKCRFVAERRKKR